MSASTVSDIMSKSKDPSYEVRHHALHALTSSELSSHADQLFEFLLRSQVPESMRLVDLLSLQNDVYDRLMWEHLKLQDLLDLSIQVIDDESANSVWRDYNIQKLGMILTLNQMSPESCDRAFAQLDRLTLGSIPGMQGTALVAAHSLRDHANHEGRTYVGDQVLGERALACAVSSEADPIDRFTALQVAARCGNIEALPYARSLLSATGESKPSPMLKISAICVVGILGNEFEIPSLQKFRRSPDIRISRAARSAILKIQARI